MRLNSINSPVIHNQQVLVGVYRYHIALTPPLLLATGPLHDRQGLLLHFQSPDGRSDSWGEAAPLPGFSQQSLIETEQALRYWLAGESDFEQLPACLQFALDMATSKIAAELPAPQNPPQAAKLVTADQQPKQLPKLAKLKLGSTTIASDIQRFNALAKQFPETRWRIDCNQGWTLAQSKQFAEQVNLSAIDFIEEPCVTYEQSQELAKSGVPVALDETVQQPNYQPEHFAGLAGVVCKPTLVGSLQRCQQLKDFCLVQDIPLVISGCFESNLAHDYLTRLAESWMPNVVPGLDTLSRLNADLLRPRSTNAGVPVVPVEQLEVVWQAQGLSL